MRPLFLGNAVIVIVLIVVPCVAFGVAVVAILDRLGVLSRLDTGSRITDNESSGLLACAPSPVMIGALVLMSLWVLVWIVLLVVGLSVLSA